MATQPLTSLSQGSNIFIDANVFIHALNGKSGQCMEFLERCSREEVTGITLFETVNEATHRFMLAEAVANGHIKSHKAEELRGKFKIIPTLTHYWQQSQRILSLNVLFLPTQESIVRDAQAVRSSACLLTNDSMIVACMRQFGISHIASTDRDFERVNGITVFRPDDI